MASYSMTMIYYICASDEDFGYMSFFLKIYRKSTKRLIHDEESLELVRIDTCLNRIKSVPFSETKKRAGADLIVIEYFFRFIDNIIFIFNDILNYQFFDSADITFDKSIIDLIFIVNR